MAFDPTGRRHHELRPRASLAQAPERAFIGLFAAMGTAPFYERHGFVVHEALTGMFQVVQGGRDGA